MKTVTVSNNQSIWDIAVQEYGSYDAVKQLIIDNPTLNFNDSIAPGTQLIIAGAIVNKTIVDFLSKSGIKPTTAINTPNPVNWILIGGNWMDTGLWVDLENWNDGSEPIYIYPPTES